VVHGEAVDGGMTAEERRKLEECRQMTVSMIPGASCFTPARSLRWLARRQGAQRIC
jgi:hypothetical protein